MIVLHAFSHYEKDYLFWKTASEDFISVEAITGVDSVSYTGWNVEVVSHESFKMILDRNSQWLLLRNYACTHHALKVIAYST